MIKITLDDSFKKWTCYLGVFFIGMIFLSGCNFPSSSRPPTPDNFTNDSRWATDPVNIQFQLELPQPNAGEESIVVEIFDDVTGLPFNGKRYELIALSNQVYVTTLSVPSGSVIKYRYGKVSEEFVPETTPDGSPITYRMLFASRNEIVQDVLQAWQSEPYTGGTGILKGTLVDTVTNQPIQDMLVCAGGKRTFTDANGKYLLEGLSEGTHNLVFYAMDGKYRTFQQGATISASMTTTADMQLTPMPEVRVTFQVMPPGEALGAPIYLAGNIFQFGNTFAKSTGSMSVYPKRMPALTPHQDGTLSVTLTLYAETDLRYKFTLGTGYWNAEQSNEGGFRTRQLIVPTEDAVINHTIDTWRSPGIEPVTFSVTIPPGTSPRDEKFIQLRTDQWTEPIPLWPLGNGEYLYILFSPLEPNQTVHYQFCRNGDCARARDAGSVSFERQFQPAQNPQTITLTLDRWENWTPLEQGALIVDAFVPTKPAWYQTTIELSPEMNPAWRVFSPTGIARLEELNAENVVFSPQWLVNPGSPYLHPELGLTPLTGELITLVNTTHSPGFDTAIFPQIGPNHMIENWWMDTAHTKAWWNEFFKSYRGFILNYAQIAQISGAEALILGGKSLLPAFEGGLLPDGSDSKVPLGFDNDWLTLLEDVREIYDGQLIWSTNVNREMDPLPDFIYEFDEIYISVDSPLALGDHPTFEMIQSGFTRVIDEEIYEVYRSTAKPITLALAYPSVEMAASGCALIDDSCYNDGLFQTSELAPYMIQMEDQALIYNAVLPILASRDWITGVSIRGYEPSVTIQDSSSSIAGKPAADVVQYWFTQMQP